MASPVPVFSETEGIEDWAYRNELTALTPGIELSLPLSVWLAPTSPFHTATDGGSSK